MRKILKHRVVGLFFGAGFILVAAGWLRAYFALRNVSQPLILHFSNAAGINQIGGMKDLSAAAVFALVALALDFMLSLELDKRDPFLGKITAAAGLFFAILIFIGFSAIISAN